MRGVGKTGSPVESAVGSASEGSPVGMYHRPTTLDHLPPTAPSYTLPRPLSHLMLPLPSMADPSPS